MNEYFAISPNYTTIDFPDIGNSSVDDQIRVHSDRVFGWQIEQAEALRAAPLTGQHSGFAVLSIIVSYFESTEMYREGYVRKPGDRVSTKFLKQGLTRVLGPLMEAGVDFRKVARMLSEEVRNGMYHEAITGPRIILQRLAPPQVMLAYTNGNENLTALRIDPHRLVEVVRSDFEGYVAELQVPTNVKLRDNFQLHFRGRKGL